MTNKWLYDPLTGNVVRGKIIVNTITGEEFIPKKRINDYAQYHKFAIKNVIFSEPATIVFWKDGTKTVVKCSDDDTFNPEVGIAMCIVKKLYGEDKYHGVFRKAIKNSIVQEKEEEPKLYFCRRFGLRCKFATRYGKCVKFSTKDECGGKKCK